MIIDFQLKLTRRLLEWSAASVILGALLMLFGNLFWRAFGGMAVAWGLVDAAIAWFGQRSALRQQAASLSPADQTRRARNLSRLLWVNAGLDVMYIAVGLGMAFSLGRYNPIWRGYGWGIVVQGAFLFLFDAFHALRVPPAPALRFPLVFQGPEHQPFLWESGMPAALLVHGFPGTPDEVRPLAQALYAQGWTVQGLLLPGFGPQMAAMGEYSFEDWHAAVVQALESLQSQHSPVMLVGYSMGGALSIIAAAAREVDGLALLAPFLWPDALWQRLLAPVLALVLPRYLQPLRKANFANPEIQRAVWGFFPGLDLDDPQVQEELRQLKIPIALLSGLRQAGLEAYKRMGNLDIPTLVVQGSQDKTIQPERTRRLLERFGKRPIYMEVQAGHDLVCADSPGFPEAARAVCEFAAQVEKSFLPKGSIEHTGRSEIKSL
jgi:esterase/lipase